MLVSLFFCLPFPLNLRIVHGPLSLSPILLCSDITHMVFSHSFSLARLHIGLLSQCLTLRELKETKEGLPGNLDKTYEEALQRMEQSLGERRWKAVRRLLQWVAWAARPLNVGELEHAMDARDGVDAIDTDEILSIQRIVSWSGGLMFVDDESLVRVIHPTTDRFFSQRRHELLCRWRHDDRARYLQMGCIQKRVIGLFGAMWTEARPGYRKICYDNPFFKYATCFMAVHIQRSPPKDDDMRVAAFLLSDAKRLLAQKL